MIIIPIWLFILFIVLSSITALSILVMAISLISAIISDGGYYYEN